MTWLYCPSATATQEPNSPSDPWAGYEPYVVLSGMLTRRPHSWREWSSRDWITHLSGIASKPSTVQRGVDEFISSLPVSLASPSPLQDVDVALTMTGGSGPKSPASSATWDRATSCWKTCPSLFDEDSHTYSTTLPASGSMWNGVCTPRQPLAHRTDGRASGLWPTTQASNGNQRALNPPSDDYGATLVDAAMLWPLDPPSEAVDEMWGTPVARDDQKSPNAHLAMKARMGGVGRSRLHSRCRRNSGRLRVPRCKRIGRLATRRVTATVMG